MPNFPPTVEQVLTAQCWILLVEDNEISHDVIKQQVCLFGYACEAAEDGLAALQLWRSGRYALLRTKCHMSRMDGFALTVAIRDAEPEGTHLPIVTITANAMPGEAQRCLAHGMDDHVSEPIRMENLAPMLHNWLPLSQGFVRELQPASLRVTELALLAIWDRTTLGKMMGDNLALQRNLFEKFLTKAEQQVADIQSAISEGNLVRAFDLAHALKSSSRTVGAVQLGELSELIESAGVNLDASTCTLLSSYLSFTYLSTQAVIRFRFEF